VKSTGHEAPAPVEFRDRNRFISGYVDLILRNSGRPQHAHDVSALCFAKASHNFRGTRSSGPLQTSARTRRQRPPLGAEGALVVSESGKRDAQRMVAISAYIAQHDDGFIELGYDEVCRTIAIDIDCNDPAAAA